jgi:hypothetical protein
VARPRALQTLGLKFFVVYRMAFGIVNLLLVFLCRGTARTAPARPVQRPMALPPEGYTRAHIDSDGKPPAK